MIILNHLKISPSERIFFIKRIILIIGNLLETDKNFHILRGNIFNKLYNYNTKLSLIDC